MHRSSEPSEQLGRRKIIVIGCQDSAAQIESVNSRRWMSELRFQTHHASLVTNCAQRQRDTPPEQLYKAQEVGRYVWTIDQRSPNGRESKARVFPQSVLKNDLGRKLALAV